MNKLNNYLNKPEDKTPENLSYVEYLVQKFKSSETRRNMITGVEYYGGKHDILKKVRTMIGENGNLEVVDNLPNNKRLDNQYRLAVKKKINYLMGKPPTYETGMEEVKAILDDRFNRKLKYAIKDCLNCGIAFFYVYIDDNSKLAFKKLKPYECFPYWKDTEHTELEFLIRVYKQNDYINGAEVENEYVEVYTVNDLKRYKVSGNTLIHIKTEHYITDLEENSYNWGLVPIIPFKYNEEEKPLINDVKSLQDGINELLSMFNDNMEENPRNSILVIKNYDGQKLDEFRKNLNAFGAVKVKNDGGVNTLHVEVNSSNYLSILSVLKNALIENAMSYDAKDDRLSGNPNQMNIQSMYSDIDIDSNGLETEFHASFELLNDFLEIYIQSQYNKPLKLEDRVDITFNRDVLINESQVIQDIAQSKGIISNETLIKKHPYVEDVQKELELIKAEQEEMINQLEQYPVGGLNE